jgi:triacylglycerol lipase
MTPQQEDAQYALMCLFAEDQYDAYPATLEPPLDPRFASDWTLRGYVSGTDAILVAGTALSHGERVCYGVLLESKPAPGTFAIVIRGTKGIIEWIEDAIFSLTGYPFGGRVEVGFWSIYGSLAFHSLTGSEAPLIPSLVGILGPSANITVVGHSLGAALATYLAVDLSSRREPLTVSSRFFASPHPGDGAFGLYAASLLKDCRSYAYALDMVPRVPFEFGYEQLPGTIKLGVDNVQARIRRSLMCSHHALSYATLLDGSAPAIALLSLDAPYVACLLSDAPQMTP